VGKVLIPLVEGFEEIEAVAPIDLLRRAGLEVVTAGVGSRQVRGSHGIVVEADALLADVVGDSFDLIMLPGGPGTRKLMDVAELQHALKAQVAAGRSVAAICAAPTVLAKAGLLRGRRVACFPAVEDELVGATVVREDVVIDGNMITSRGAGTSIPFALAIIAHLCGQAKAEEVARSVVYRGAMQVQ